MSLGVKITATFVLGAFGTSVGRAKVSVPLTVVPAMFVNVPLNVEFVNRWP